jgi:hypothetical protein
MNSPLHSPYQPSSNSSSYKKPNNHNFTLPSTKDIPILTGKHDWGSWHTAVWTLIDCSNLLGHILGEPLPGALYDPDLEPLFPPIITRLSSPDEKAEYSEWWNKDKIVSYILTSRLSPSVLGTLPIANAQLGLRRSARVAYTTLKNNYGAGDYSAVMSIEARLRRLRCLPARGGVRVPEYISTWRSSYNQMEAAGYPPSSRQALTMFADGLLTNTVSFVNLHDTIITSLNEPDETLLPNLYYLFDQVIRLDNIAIRSRTLHNDGRLHNPTIHQPPTPTSTTLIPSATNSKPASTSTPTDSTPSQPNAMGRSRKCNNCGGVGHTDATCFQSGGGMEGRRDEYLANRPARAQVHLANTDITPDGEIELEQIDETVLTDEFAAMSLTLTNDIELSTYNLSPTATLCDQSYEPIVLAALSKQFNSALDSACTNHIIRDHNLFHTYDTNGALPVKTANCGILPTLAMGDVKFRLNIEGRSITWTLKNCLHAPAVPINLISVGALQENHLSINFSFQKTTISFPMTHPHLKGLSFDATVVNRLSMLLLDFIPPVTKLTPSAFASFPIPSNSFELWHRRFGHLGQDATKDILTKDYATGIKYIPSPNVASRCIPCLIGKAPQVPFPHHAKRANVICELIHIDTCGPFPTLTPRKEAYFTIYLDDA